MEVNAVNVHEHGHGGRSAQWHPQKSTTVHARSDVSCSIQLYNDFSLPRSM